MPQMCPQCSRNNQDVARFCAGCGTKLRGLLGQNTFLEGRYRVSRVLGCGGMGAVYLAEDQRIAGRLVAIKENLDLSAQAQFEAEVKVMASLQQAGLPQIHDHFTSATGRQYLVMDYVAGDTLEDLVAKRGALPEAEVAALAGQMLEILGYLHANRVIHRDVKPANIKRDPNGRLVLVDFGIAKRQVTSTITQAWAKGVGSPGFAPLEQYSGGTDERSDLYSLGAVLYFLLTGQVPPEATDLAGGTPLPPPSRQRAGISPAMDPLILRAMALPQAQRFQSAAEMRQALPAPPGRPTIVRPPVPPTVPVPVAPPSTSQRSLVLVGTGIALAVVAVSAVFLVSRNQIPPSAPTPVVLAPVATDTPSAVPTATAAHASGEDTAEALAVPSSTDTLYPPTQTPLPPTPRPPTVTPIPPTPTPEPSPQAIPQGDGLNIRAGPGTNYDIITRVNRSTKLPISGRSDDCRWFQVLAPGGRQGWVATEFVNANVASCEPQLAVAPPTSTPKPTPTANPVATPKPAPVPQPSGALANNLSQFSGSQGANGWWYQIEQGRNSGNFADFPSFGSYQSGDGKPARSCWLTSQEGHVRICQEGEVHPGGTGRIALRWQSDATRNVRVQVHAHKIDTSCGNNDGVWIGVFRVPAGQPPGKIGEFSISGGSNQDRPANTNSWNVGLNAGDSIMVMVDVARAPACDMTRLYVDIF